MEIKTEIQKDSYAVKITAEEDGTVKGWAYIYILSNDRHTEPFAFLENVYVELEYRGQGIGKKLVAKAMQEAKERGCYKILGTSRHPKTDVHKFYESFGFKNWGLEFRMDIKESQIKQVD